MEGVALAVNVKAGRAVRPRAHIGLEGAEGREDLLVASLDRDFNLAAPVLALHEPCVES
jgi:hypothetical protein